MTRERKDLGDLGEELAAQELLSLGYHVLERNSRSRLGEIDIIAEKNGCVYFAEVKTRRNNDFGAPLESITPAKRRKLLLLARQYLAKQGKEVPCQFIFISVNMEEKKIEIVDDIL